MKKYIKILVLLLALPVTLSGCIAGIDLPDSDSRGERQVTFRFGLQDGYEDGDTSVRTAAVERKIAAMWYAIADERGNLFNPEFQKMESDFSKLLVEGLQYGEYTVVFLATTDKGISVQQLADLSSAWLRQEDAGMPLGEEFFYRKMPLSIGEEQAPVVVKVDLARCVARVDVEIATASEYMERFIKEVRVTFDRDDAVYTAFHADGNCSGAGSVKDHDITRTRSFLSLPGRGGNSGYVSVTSVRSDGTDFTRTYLFRDCEVKAGHISRIRIDYRHPEDNYGLMYVRMQDFPVFKADTMFLADEPRSVFYDQKHRSFYVNAPLRVNISDDKKLRIRFFSPATVRDVTILCRFNKYSTEYFELAHFDVVYPFMEINLPMPLLKSAQTFKSASGRHVSIPAQPDLGDADVTFAIRSEDPYMKKIEQINYRWHINFSAYTADKEGTNWAHMDPMLCRHGVALVLNMAFMFSSAEFNEELQKYDGKLYDDRQNTISLDLLRRKISEHEGLVLGRVTGVGGLGAGTTYGLAKYVYELVYFDCETNLGAHTYSREAMFHEYGHCLGYGHSSNMTYGGAWTVLCANTYVNMGKEGKLPVCSRSEVEDLPM